MNAKDRQLMADRESEKLVFPKVTYCPTCGGKDLTFHKSYPDKEVKFYECRNDACNTHFLVSGEYVFGLTSWKAESDNYTTHDQK